MLTGDFGYPVVYQFGLFRIRKPRIKGQHVGDVRVRIFRGEFPLDLDDGTVYFYAEKIFRLAGNGDRSLNVMIPLIFGMVALRTYE